MERRKAPSSSRSFIEEWCKYYGLDSKTAKYLADAGYATGDDILTLYVDDIRRLPNLDETRKCLLRGAILQYRQGRQPVDRELQKKGVVIQPRPTVKKRVMRSVWRHHASTVQKIDMAIMSMLTEDQREAVRELRRRLRHKRSTDDGRTLYERILERRKTLTNLGSQAADKQEVGKKDNEPRQGRTEDTSGKTAAETEITKDDQSRVRSEAVHPKSVTSLDADDVKVCRPETTKTASSKSSSGGTLANGSGSQQATDQRSEEELSEELDKMLESLLMVGLDDSAADDPDAPEVDLEASQRMTEEILQKLEDELFTEEEMIFVIKLREIRKKYDDVACPEYEEEVQKLIDSMC